MQFISGLQGRAVLRRTQKAAPGLPAFSEIKGRSRWMCPE